MGSENATNAAPVHGIVIHPSPVWRPAIGKNLADYPWGTLCKDRNGNEILIGDCIDGSDYDGGCGCCSDRIAEGDIVEVATILEYVRKDG